MRRIKGYCPQGRCSPARILNKLAAFERRAAEKQQSCGWRRLISLSCHSACWVSIHHWGVYHMSDSVSTLVVRQAGEHDGWVLSSDTIRPVRAKRPEPVHNDQITPPPASPPPPLAAPPLCSLFSMALHQENGLRLHCLPQKINVTHSTDQ